MCFMRRFEFVDGPSSKFWEISVEGTGFTVRFGRIGTAGQTQQKSFASEEKAKAEHDKLVAEKVKKGYAEVGGGNVAAPNVVAAASAAPAVSAPAAPKKTAKAEPPPEPSVPVAATIAEPPPNTLIPGARLQEHPRPIAWDDAYIDRVHPRRRGVPVRVRPPHSAAKAWAETRRRYEQLEPFVQKGLETESIFKDELRSIAARIAVDVPSVGAPLEDAVLLAILQHAFTYSEKSRFEPFVDFLFQVGGPEHAVKTLMLSINLSTGAARGTPPSGTLVVSRGRVVHSWQSFGSGNMKGFPRLRELLAAHTDEAAYAAARDACDFANFDPDQESAAAYLFPTEPSWALSAAFAVRDEPNDMYLYAAVSTDEAATALVNRTKTYQLFERGGDFLPSFLDGMGPAALQHLLRLGGNLPSVEAKRDWADAIARINSEEAVKHLVDRLDSDLAVAVSEAAARWPSKALRHLAEKAAVRGKGGDVARTVLGGVVRKLGASLPMEGISEEGRRAIDALQAQAGPDVPEASLDRLAPVLVSPPWRAKTKSKPLPVVKDLKAWTPADELREEPAPQQDPAATYWGRRSTAQHYADGDWDRVRRGAVELPERLGVDFFFHAPPDLFERYLDRYVPGQDYVFHDAQWMPALIAKHRLGALPILARFAGTYAQHAKLLLPFAATSLAPRMAELFAKSKKFRADGRAWLLRYPQHAAAGLLADALGGPGRARDNAIVALRLLGAHHESHLLSAAEKSTPNVVEELEAMLALDPLSLYPSRLPSLPSFFDPAALPPVLLRDKAAKLPPSAVETLAVMLSFNDPTSPYEGLHQVKVACDPQSLARFAWALFEAWSAAGFPSKEAWAFQALGALGDDEVARKLTPILRDWPGEGAHARAVSGLQVLASIGTDVTLTYLNAIAEKAKHKGLQKNAQEKISEIAEARGLTREELADRLAPDLGLDQDGSMILDFGARRFTVGFDELLKPYVKDADGARLKELPKPTKKDDEAKATAAEERWKALKKDAKAVSAMQVLRLELAMCARRRWTPEVFGQFFVGHPLLVHVVRRLIWGAFDDQGHLIATFRVAEDRTFADQDDEGWELPAGAKVGLPHALELDAKTAAAWGQLLADYQMLQPFPQLGRPTFNITPEERSAKTFTRVEGVKVATGKVLGLEARGWRRGPALDGGVAAWMQRELGDGRILQLNLDPGLYTGMLSESPEQTLQKCEVREEHSWGDGPASALGTLDPVVFSELVKDLEALRP